MSTRHRLESDAVYAEIKRVDQLMQAGFKRIDDLRSADAAALSAALASSEKAVTKAETAQQRTNESQNEFRGALRDAGQLQMPRAEAEQLLRALSDRVTLVEKATANFSSREQGIFTTAAAGRNLILLAASVAVAIIAYLALIRP